jgi:hypothetical protein
MPESLELHQDIQIIKHEVSAHRQLTRTLLTLQRSKLLQQKLGIFMGKTKPKRRLIELYLALASESTRNELVELGFPKGTVFRYCLLLIREALVEVKEELPDGQEVLRHTFIEEITHLSRELEKLL